MARSFLGSDVVRDTWNYSDIVLSFESTSFPCRALDVELSSKSQKRRCDLRVMSTGPNKRGRPVACRAAQNHAPKKKPRHDAGLELRESKHGAYAVNGDGGRGGGQLATEIAAAYADAQ